MAGVNKVILLGNIGKEPEIRYLDANTPRLSFSLATTDVYKDKNGNRAEHTEWHNIVMWRALAQHAEKTLKKGLRIYVEGKIQSREWIDKEGHKKHITEIIAETFQII